MLVAIMSLRAIFLIVEIETWWIKAQETSKRNEKYSFTEHFRTFTKIYVYHSYASEAPERRVITTSQHDKTWWDEVDPFYIAAFTPQNICEEDWYYRRKDGSILSCQIVDGCFDNDWNSWSNEHW